MALIKNKDLIREVATARKKLYTVNEKEVSFIVERFMHYAIIALSHGYSFSWGYYMKFSLVYALFGDIPKRMQKRFTFSPKMFGCVFMPDCSERIMKKIGSSYKPNKYVLSKIAEVTDTDEVYKLVK